MKSLKYSLCVSAVLLCSPVYGKGYRLELSPTSPQASRYIDGRKTVDDRTEATAARVIQPLDPLSKQGEFQVFVVNSGNAPFNFGPESVAVRLPDGTSIVMLTYDDLMRQQKRREGRRRFAAALGAMGRSMSASSAGYNYGSVNYSGQSYGTYGGTPYTANSYGMGNYSGYNGAAAFAAQQQANRDNQAELAQLEAEQAAARTQIGSYMKTTTIEPGQAFGGTLQFELPTALKSSKSPMPLTIEVRTGNETHIFQATFSKN